MGILSLAKGFSKTGRRLKRKEKSLEKARSKAQVADIESELAFREKEDPREASHLKQSMFARGLGKSTINTQGATRLADMQSRRRAALLRQKDLAHRGLSLIKLRARAARRFAPYDITESILGQDPSFSSVPGMGGTKEEAGGEWSPTETSTGE